MILIYHLKFKCINEGFELFVREVDSIQKQYRLGITG